jgi:hypothetical protein
VCVPSLLSDHLEFKHRGTITFHLHPRHSKHGLNLQDAEIKATGKMSTSQPHRIQNGARLLLALNYNALVIC